METGEPFTVIECSDFNLLNRFVSGEDIEPVLAQRADCGFNMLRVWTRYVLDGTPPIGRCTLADHPDLYERIQAFLQACARHGLYVEFTAYVSGVGDPVTDYDPQHWARLGAAVQGETNVILELVNEHDQHARLDLTLFAPIPNVLCSHGSNGSEQESVLPHWDYAVFHTNGANEWWRKAGHNTMEQGDLPAIANENTRFPDNDDSLAHAFDAAAGAALLCAGSCFHSTAGKPSVLFDAALEVLARAWVAGARSVPLTCQAGGYKHRSDLEGPNDLRIYQRGNDPACVVRIRR